MFLVIPLLLSCGVQSRTCRNDIQDIVSGGIGDFVGKAVVCFNPQAVLRTTVVRLPAIHQNVDRKKKCHHCNSKVAHEERRFERRFSKHILREDRRSNPHEALQHNATQTEDIASANFASRAYLDCGNLAEHG